MSACGMVACWCAWGFRVDRLRRRGVVCACLWNAPLLTAVVVVFSNLVVDVLYAYLDPRIRYQ